jgi:hypothetical protein
VGPREARERFLIDKVEQVEAKLATLSDLPHQHALLLLTQCVQQDLRHLQRTLRSDDLDHVWDRLDSAIWEAARRIRGARDPDVPAYDTTILSLPVRLGGLGLLSHRICSPPAYAAASESSDHLLSSLIGPPPAPPTLADSDNPDSILSQRLRCQPIFEVERERLFGSISQLGQQSVLEAASALGRKWLSVIPYYQSLRLTDFEVSSALHIRTLLIGHWVQCQFCGIINEIGHDEVCGARRSWVLARHEQVKRAVGDALEGIPGARIELEPAIGMTQRRNDIRITGSRESGISSHEYDVSVVSLASRDAQATTLPPPTDNTSLSSLAFATANKYLASVAAEKLNRLPPAASPVPFTPIILSLGGLMESETAKAFNSWKTSLPSGTFRHLLRRLSLILLRARVRNFDL